MIGSGTCTRSDPSNIEKNIPSNAKSHPKELGWLLLLR